MSEPKHKEPPQTHSIAHVATGRDVLFTLAAAWSASAGRPVPTSRSVSTAATARENKARANKDAFSPSVQTVARNVTQTS